MHAKSNSARPASVKPATILVGVSGGIAAYKSVDLVSRLKKNGHQVHVLMTEAATRFVTPLTFEAISGHRVSNSVFPEGSVEKSEQAYPHLYPATSADVFIVAPATADIIARLAAGIGSDAVTTSALSLPENCRKFFAPAMNVEMWHQPVVQQNVARLEQLGWLRIGPDAGELACGMTGEGRMTEPAQLVEAIENSETASPATNELAGKRVLILSGPTCEHIDPIRFISNASSGKMGKALAEQAARLGAEVIFVTGPVPEANVPCHPSIRVEKVVSADNLLRAGRHHFAQSDVIVYAAAVADYRPAKFTEEKMPKQTGTVTLCLEATPDVAATLNKEKRPGQIAVGFALQTHDGEKRALEKMRAKKFDGIVLNAPDALGGNDGSYTFFDATSELPAQWGKLAKRECASRIYRFVAQKFP
jgi:phosphopantothenoylcysteine decarboxylase / phosphopantothenate---cysteine ligase